MWREDIIHCCLTLRQHNLTITIIILPLLEPYISLSLLSRFFLHSFLVWNMLHSLHCVILLSLRCTLFLLLVSPFGNRDSGSCPNIPNWEVYCAARLWTNVSVWTPSGASLVKLVVIPADPDSRLVVQTAMVLEQRSAISRRLATSRVPP